MGDPYAFLSNAGLLYQKSEKDESTFYACLDDSKFVKGASAGVGARGHPSHRLRNYSEPLAAGVSDDQQTIWSSGLAAHAAQSVACLQHFHAFFSTSAFKHVPFAVKPLPKPSFRSSIWLRYLDIAPNREGSHSRTDLIPTRRPQDVSGLSAGIDLLGKGLSSPQLHMELRTPSPPTELPPSPPRTPSSSQPATQPLSQATGSCALLSVLPTRAAAPPQAFQNLGVQRQPEEEEAPLWESVSEDECDLSDWDAGAGVQGDGDALWEACSSDEDEGGGPGEPLALPVVHAPWDQQPISDDQVWQTVAGGGALQYHPGAQEEKQTGCMVGGLDGTGAVRAPAVHTSAAPAIELEGTPLNTSLVDEGALLMASLQDDLNSSDPSIKKSTHTHPRRIYAGCHLDGSAWIVLLDTDGSLFEYSDDLAKWIAVQGSTFVTWRRASVGGFGEMCGVTAGNRLFVRARRQQVLQPNQERPHTETVTSCNGRLSPHVFSEGYLRRSHRAPHYILTPEHVWQEVPLPTNDDGAPYEGPTSLRPLPSGAIGEVKDIAMGRPHVLWVLTSTQRIFFRNTSSVPCDTGRSPGCSACGRALGESREWVEVHVTNGEGVYVRQLVAGADGSVLLLVNQGVPFLLEYGLQPAHAPTAIHLCTANKPGRCARSLTAPLRLSTDHATSAVHDPSPRNLEGIGIEPTSDGRRWDGLPMSAPAPPHNEFAGFSVPCKCSRPMVQGMLRRLVNRVIDCAWQSYSRNCWERMALGRMFRPEWEGVVSPFVVPTEECVDRALASAAYVEEEVYDVHASLELAEKDIPILDISLANYNNIWAVDALGSLNRWCPRTGDFEPTSFSAAHVSGNACGDLWGLTPDDLNGSSLLVHLPPTDPHTHHEHRCMGGYSALRGAPPALESHNSAPAIVRRSAAPASKPLPSAHFPSAQSREPSTVAPADHNDACRDESPFAPRRATESCGRVDLHRPARLAPPPPQLQAGEVSPPSRRVLDPASPPSPCTRVLGAARPAPSIFSSTPPPGSPKPARLQRLNTPSPVHARAVARVFASTPPPPRTDTPDAQPAARSTSPLAPAARAPLASSPPVDSTDAYAAEGAGAVSLQGSLQDSRQGIPALGGRRDTLHIFRLEAVRLQLRTTLSFARVAEVRDCGIALTFFRPQGPRGYCVLGDLVEVEVGGGRGGGRMGPRTPALLGRACGFPHLLADPRGFELVHADPSGVHVWLPLPPSDEFAALGCVVSTDAHPPHPGVVRCVRRAALTQGVLDTAFWAALPLPRRSMWARRAVVVAGVAPRPCTRGPPPSASLFLRALSPATFFWTSKDCKTPPAPYCLAAGCLADLQA